MLAELRLPLWIGIIICLVLHAGCAHPPSRPPIPDKFISGPSLLNLTEKTFLAYLESNTGDKNQVVLPPTRKLVDFGNGKIQINEIILSDGTRKLYKISRMSATLPAKQDPLETKPEQTWELTELQTHYTPQMLAEKEGSIWVLDDRGVVSISYQEYRKDALDYFAGNKKKLKNEIPKIPVCRNDTEKVKIDKNWRPLYLAGSVFTYFCKLLDCTDEPEDPNHANFPNSSVSNRGLIPLQGC